PWDTSDDADSEWSASGSVETNPDTTIDDNSGDGQADARILHVAEATGFETDRTYLVGSEWFDVLEIGDGTVTARHPLHNAYSNGDAVQSTRILATIPDAWVADSANLRDDAGPNPHYRVRWVYVV